MIQTEYPAIHKALREQIAALTAERDRLTRITSNLELKVAELSVERDALQAATRKVVDALDRCESNRGRFSCTPWHDGRCELDRQIGGECTCGSTELQSALADPTIVALGRE